MIVESMDRPAVTLDDHDEIVEVLSSDAFGPDWDHPRSPLFAGTILMLEGEEHRHRRRLESPLFTKAAMRAYREASLEPNVRSVLAECVQSVQAQASSSLDLVPLLRTMMHRLAAAIAGIHMGGDPAEVEDLVDLQRRISEGGGVGYRARDAVMLVRDAIAAKKEFSARFVEPSIDRRRANPGSDLISLLLADTSTDELSTMVAEAMLYFAASTGTTGKAVPHGLVEIVAWMGRTGRSDLDSDFFHRAAAETLRVHPSTPLLFRRAERDTELSSGRVVAAGTHVWMDVWAVNHDKRFFGDDADTFDPYRTIPADIRPWGLAFGAGPHRCIGEPLAVGAPAGGGTRADGILAVVLEHLIRAGIVPDPARRARTHAIGKSFSYDAFPVTVVAR